MTYEDFKQYLHLDNIDDKTHIAILLSNPPGDQASFPDYFSANAENIQIFYFLLKYGKAFIILNKDVILKDTLIDYELVTDLPSNTEGNI